jgi:hypothetical protein
MLQALFVSPEKLQKSIGAKKISEETHALIMLDQDDTTFVLNAPTASIVDLYRLFAQITTTANLTLIGTYCSDSMALAYDMQCYEYDNTRVLLYLCGLPGKSFISSNDKIVSGLNDACGTQKHKDSLAEQTRALFISFAAIVSLCILGNIAYRARTQIATHLQLARAQFGAGLDYSHNRVILLTDTVIQGGARLMNGARDAVRQAQAPEAVVNLAIADSELDLAIVRNEPEDHQASEPAPTPLHSSVSMTSHDPATIALPPAYQEVATPMIGVNSPAASHRRFAMFRPSYEAVAQSAVEVVQVAEEEQPLRFG